MMMNATKVVEKISGRPSLMTSVIGRASVILGLLFATSIVCAQESAPRTGPGGEPPRREGGRRGFPGRERAPLAEERANFLARLVADTEKRETKWDKRRLGAFARMAEDALRSMTADEFKAASAKTPAEVEADIFAAADRRRDAKDEKFLKTLPAEEAAKIGALPKDERRRKIDDLRVNEQLEAALKNAMAQGVIGDDVADEMRKGDTKARMKAIVKLNTQVFMHVHAQDMSPQTRERLEKLEPEQFFRDPFVERYRLIDALKRDDIDKVMKLAPDERQRVFAAIGADPIDPELGRWFSKEAVERLRGLSRDDRSRLVFELSHIHGAKRRFMLPPELMKLLNDDDRQKLTGMSTDETIAYLRPRFPDLDWKELEPRLRMRARFDEMISALTAADREKLWHMSPDERDRFFVQRFGDTPEVKNVMETMKREFSARGRRMFLPPDITKQLTPEESTKLAKMEPKEAMIFLVDRFPDVYRERLERVLELTRLKMPDTWANMKTAEKVSFLFEHASSPGELMRLFTFVRGMRRGDRGPDHERGEREHGERGDRDFGPGRRPESRPAESRPASPRPK